MTDISPRQQRWNKHADEGVCRYCEVEGPVKPDPFAQEEACFSCWEALAYGDEE